MCQMINAVKKSLSIASVVSLASLSAVSTSHADGEGQPLHNIGVAKLIVNDLKAAQGYYETYYLTKETKRYDYAPEVFEETIQSFGKGPSLALFAPNPKAEQPVPKSQYPQVLLYTDEFDALTQRLEEGGQPLYRLPKAMSGPYTIAIATDPSGNRIEIFSRSGGNRIGASKLIVDDRAKAEAFYQKIFNATPGQRFNTAAYDEVLMEFGNDVVLALFQPLTEKPLEKSNFPLVAIYTSDFDGVMERIKEAGLGYRDVVTQTPSLRIAIAKDPAGNAIEIIKRR